MNFLTRKENQTPATATAAPDRYARPHYEVSELNDAFSVRVHIPGVSKSGVSVNYEADTLTITGTRTHRAADDWRPITRPLSEDNYRLVLSLNVEIDADKIAAKTEDGVLTLTLPKTEAVKARQISIE